MKLLFENWRKFLKENNTNFISDLIDDLSGKLHNVDNEEIEDWMGNFITTLKMYQTILKRRSPEQVSEWLKNALTYKGRDHYDWLEEHAPEYSADWKQLIEDENVPLIATFDFDNTLAFSHWGEEEDDWVFDGPNQEIINTLRDYHREGTKVYIITSRYKEVKDEDGNWYSFHPRTKPSKKYFKGYQMPVWNFVQKYGLPIEDVIFTNGEIKSKAEDGLIEIGSEIHYDDDIDEINAAQEAGVRTVHVKLREDEEKKINDF